MLGDEFSLHYVRAFQALQVKVMTELLQAQRELQALAGSVSDEADRSYALGRVHLLAEDFGLEPMSLERREAEIVLYSTDHHAGTRAEQLVAIASTRKKIWEIADRAGEDAPAIRYMTRALDGMEHDIEFSSSYPWNDDYNPRDDYNPGD
jgi:hypothetical protein